jgi:ankyrin repeat protein
MAIEKEEFFEIIKNVSESKDLSEGNLLEMVRKELFRKDEGGHNKFHLDFDKNHQFSIKISNKIEDWTLLHLAAECDNRSIVELLLNKKVSVNTRVSDGSEDGLTALHIAASYGNKEVIELLLSDNRINPLLKSRNKTPREMVGNWPNRNAIKKMLEEGEKSYLTNPKQKARNIKIKLQNGGTYHLLQDSHRTLASLAVDGNNASTTLGNGKRKPEIKVQVWGENKKGNNSSVQSEQTSSNSITDESSDNIANEQHQRVSVKNMVKIFEPSQKIDTTCSSEQASAIESDGDDSGLELGPETAPSTSLHFEMNIDGTNNVERDVDNQTLESTLQSQIQLKDSRIQELEKSDKELKEVEKKLEKAQKDLETLKDRLDKNETRLKAFNKLDKENKLLKQEIEDLKSENATLKGALEENKDQHSKYVAENETKQETLNKLNEENESLEQKIENLKSENATLKDKLKENKDQHSRTNEVLLEKVEKKLPLSKIAYVSLVTTSMVGSILSIVSGLFVLSMIATSVTSALVAGGITYTMSKPTTELKEVNIQSPGNNKACEI